jgi:hypothetical protein
MSYEEKGFPPQFRKNENSFEQLDDKKIQIN